MKPAVRRSITKCRQCLSKLGRVVGATSFVKPMSVLIASIGVALGLVACHDAGHSSDVLVFKDHPEPGLQGQNLPKDRPGSILVKPYQRGVRVVGHSDVWKRDSNVQLAWVDHCAYIASSSPNFLGWGITAEPETYGVAVIDVSNPMAPRAVRVLREKGALYSAEAMAAAQWEGRKVLVAGTYEGGVQDDYSGWISIYDATDCASPTLVAEYRLPEKLHALTVAPNGKRVYATSIDPFAGTGGIHVLDITDLAQPAYLGKFPVTREDGTHFEFATHEVSVSADESRIYAGVLGSQVGDLNKGIARFPDPAAFGPNAGGVYILDNSDVAEGRPNPEMRLLGTAQHAGWHSVMPASIRGAPYLVAGGELGACPGSWPKLIDISDETAPLIVGEFKLAMNRSENCPPPTAAEQASGGLVGAPGTASLHFNDVDSAANTRLGLFQFMWSGLRIADLSNPYAPKEIAYFKPGDACGGHVRYVEESGHIWLSCASSGFYVLELAPAIKPPASLKNQ